VRATCSTCPPNAPTPRRRSLAADVGGSYGGPVADRRAMDVPAPPKQEKQKTWGALVSVTLRKI